MIVHRIEHLEYGHGPLCGSGVALLNRKWTDITEVHNSVTCTYPEILDRIDEEFQKFGMVSEKSLSALIRPSAYEILEDAGFAYYTIEVPDEHCFVFPDDQVVFEHSKGTVINIEDISTLAIE